MIRLQLWLCVLAGCGTVDVVTDEAVGLACFPANIDVGKVNPLDVRAIDCSFSLHNQSEQEIQAVKIDVSCGCLAPRSFPETLPPGTRHELQVSFRPPELPGKFEKFIVVRYNGGKGAARLSISGETLAVAKIYASPKTLNFGEIGRSEVIVRSFEILRLDRGEVGELVATSHYEGLSVKAIPSHKGGATVRLEASLEASAADQSELSGTISVHRVGAEMDVLAVPFVARVRPPNEDIFRNSIFVKKLTVEEPIAVTLVQRGVTDVRVVDYRYSGSEQIGVEITEADGLPVARVFGKSGSSNYRGQLAEGTLTLSFDGHHTGTVVIPVRALLRQSISKMKGIDNEDD